MTAFVTALQLDIVLQARNGFYWASAFVVLVVGGLLLNVTEAARADSAAWVPALVAVNLQITTFFFVAGLMLLERDEGNAHRPGSIALFAGRIPRDKNDHAHHTCRPLKRWRASVIAFGHRGVLAAHPPRDPGVRGGSTLGFPVRRGGRYASGPRDASPASDSWACFWSPVSDFGSDSCLVGSPGGPGPIVRGDTRRDPVSPSGLGPVSDRRFLGRPVPFSYPF